MIGVIQDESIDVRAIKELLTKFTRLINPHRTDLKFIQNLFKTTLQSYVDKGGILDDVDSYDGSTNMLGYFYKHYTDETVFNYLLALYIQSGQLIQPLRPLGHCDSWVPDGDHDDTGRYFFDGTINTKRRLLLLEF